MASPALLLSYRVQRLIRTTARAWGVRHAAGLTFSIAV